jgi:cell division protein FtsW
MKKSKALPMGSPDWLFLGAAIALIAIGLMMVYSSTFDIAYHSEGDAAFYVKRQALWAGLGALCMIVASQVHYRHWKKLSILMMLATLGMLITVAVLGQRTLFESSVSPVELAKLTMIIYVGHWLASKRVEQLRSMPVGLLPFSIIVGLLAGLVIVQPDISEAVVIVLVAVAMFFMAGADLLQFAIGLVGGAAVFYIVVSQISYAAERLEPYLVELRDPLNSGNFQLKQGLIALGSGGVFGLGPGAGRMKYQWLPAGHTDSIFAIVGEELGLVGCLFLVVLFAIIVYRGFRIAQRAIEPFGRYLAIGITCWLGLQALINMAVVTGTFPFTGIALPFISVGGSSLLFCMIGVGLMVNISRVSSGARVASTAGPPQAERAETELEQSWAGQR